jgi:sporulation protein YlmC with PRC-barrel domain
MMIKTLLGKRVYDSEAIEVGKVHDVEFDPTTYAITSLEVHKGFRTTLLVGIGHVTKLGDSVLLNVKSEDLLAED